VPRYRFKGTNLPQSLLKALCRDLLDADNHDQDPAAALHANYGARPNQEFIREAWPTLLESWLRITKDSRDGVEEAPKTSSRRERFAEAPRGPDEVSARPKKFQEPAKGRVARTRCHRRD
jgi:hypothetical protein